MTNRIRILRSANRTLARLPRNVQDRIDEAIDDLSQDSRPPGAKRLVGDEPIYRIRVGDYRILYSADDAAQIVTIVRIGHRRDVYRGP